MMLRPNDSTLKINNSRGITHHALFLLWIEATWRLFYRSKSNSVNQVKKMRSLFNCVIKLISICRLKIVKINRI